MIVKSCWFGGLSHAVWGNGDQFEIINCTGQSVGDDTTRDDVFTISAQAFDADDVAMNFPLCGPIIKGNWSEGGLSRYAVRVLDYPAGLVENNFIIGSSNPLNTFREGGVLAEVKTVIRNNVFYQFYTATPTEGRLDNAAVYITSGATGSKVYDNAYQLTQDGNHGYEEGTADPTGDKSGFSEIFGVVEWSDPTTPFFTSSSNSISSVAHVAPGIVQITLKYNLQSMDVPLLCSAGDSGAYTPTFINYRWLTNSSFRINVKDIAGSNFQPNRISFMVFGQANTSPL